MNQDFNAPEEPPYESLDIVLMCGNRKATIPAMSSWTAYATAEGIVVKHDGEWELFPYE